MAFPFPLRGLATALATDCVLTAVPAGAQQAAKPQHYVYVLRLAPRVQAEAGWTDADRAAVGRHFERLAKATEAGQVVLAGRTEEPLDRTFGLVVFEAESEAAARRFMDTDPAVEAGVMLATLHPYSIALLRKR
jgi:uncharacterized protein YciI